MVDLAVAVIPVYGDSMILRHTASSFLIREDVESPDLLENSR
jgi:hypothetical protein